MSYDFEGLTDHRAPIVTTYVPQATDLEAIVMMLEVAHLALTLTPDARYTEEQLFDQVRAMGGNDLVIDERDMRIVLAYMPSIRECLVKSVAR